MSRRYQAIKVAVALPVADHPAEDDLVLMGVFITARHHKKDCPLRQQRSPLSSGRASGSHRSSAKF